MSKTENKTGRPEMAPRRDQIRLQEVAIETQTASEPWSPNNGGWSGEGGRA